MGEADYKQTGKRNIVKHTFNEEKKVGREEPGQASPRSDTG